MDNADRWYFTKEQLASTPSRKCGVSETRELSFRQQAANFIQDMGQRLQVNQLCINTAIVYMHRFYVFHSFTEIHRNKLSLSALFLAAKVEEQPRKLEHLIKVAHACLHKDLPPLDVRSEAYQEKMFEVVAHENILLQTLGFVLGIEHPHTYVVKVCQLVKASKDLAQTSYIMATTSLHMTTMCLMYKPTVVACVCIHLACKWSDWRIEPCSEGRDWFFYVDRSVTNEKLETLTDRFIAIMETSPHRFKKKFGQKDVNYHGPRSLMDEPSTSKAGMSDNKYIDKQDISSPGPSGLSYDFADFDDKPLFREKSPVKSSLQSSASIIQPSSSVQPSIKPSTPVQPSSSVLSTLPSHPKKPIKEETPHSISLDVYREKREKERLQNKVSAPPPPVESPLMVPQVSKKPQHAFHEIECVPHRTSSKHAETPSVSIKEKLKVSAIKEEPVDPPTSVNKLNHQVSKVNSDRYHHKERSSYSHNAKMPHQTNDPVIKQEKIDIKQEKVDVVLKPDKVDVIKPEKVHAIKSDRVDTIKQEIVELNKLEKTDFIKQERTDVVKQERTDGVKQERIDVLKQERIDIVKQEKVDFVRQEKVDLVRPEKTDLIRQEKIEMVKQEKVDVKAEIKNSLTTAVTPSLVHKSSHKVDVSGGVEVKKERKEKHKKHSSHSSKEKITMNHSDRAAPTTGIKVKIPKTIINLSNIVPESSQKYVLPVNPESQKRSLKIKLPKPPDNSKVAKPAPSTSIKLVITKDKSGTGSYSTSHKNERERESRKRVHSNSVPDGNGKAMHDVPSAKYQKMDHSQKSHHGSASGGGKPSKSSRHSSHRSGMEHSMNDGGYSVLQHPANGNNAGSTHNAQSYSQGFMYKLTPPPPPPKLKGYGLPMGKTNSNPLLQPPLPPPQSPPPPPPPE